MPVLVLFLAILGVVALLLGVRIVNQYERGIILRLGKFRSLAEPGLNIIIPFLESMKKVDVRERVINVEPQVVITKDNVTVTVDAVIYYKIVDPVKAEFEVEDFDTAVTTLAQTNLRNLIGDKTLDETLVARDIINTSLREVLDEATNGWGVKVTRVEVQKIDPPVEISEAMSLQMKAEREKRAAILEAEGVKQSDILEAEGRRNAEILKAEGDAKARILRAEAEAQAVKVVADAANQYFKENAQMLKRLEVSQSVLEKNTKYVIPSSSDLINLLNLDGEAPHVVPVKKSEK
jgi:regulator of protease activity HflC (stomatin/prohibitin superfamily)